MDLLAIIDKEYYTKIHEEQNEKKAMVSWFDIVDSLTEDQLDDIGPIKFFIYEALGNKFPRWTNDAIRKKLTEKIKTLKTPTPSITLQADKVSFEEFPYLGLLGAVLGNMDTDKHTYTELADEMNIHTGGIRSMLSIYSDQDNRDLLYPKMSMTMKVLISKLKDGVDLMAEMITSSCAAFATSN